MASETPAVLRVLDANFNRLREALRAVEEHFRFVRTDADLSSKVKLLRHSVRQMEGGLNREELLAARDTNTDPLGGKMREEELTRSTAMDIMTSNLRRAQEATRVIEEYGKLLDSRELPQQAKSLRFALYDIEKETVEKGQNGDK